MSKHTPGPWTAHNTGEHAFTIKATSVRVNASAGEKERSYYQGIASVSERGDHPQHGGGISFKTCQANARLIAAAPELFEALKLLIAEYEPNMKAFALDAPRKAKWDAAQAAIAKVTGGAA
jgi:hypothetical protein